MIAPRRFFPLSLLTLLSAGLLLTAGPAGAETQDRCDRSDCEYRFDDENVLGAEWSAYGEWLKGRRPGERVLLIRPRTSFVMELIRSGDGV